MGEAVPAQSGGEGDVEVARFAALLRALKERTDRSYGSLARRLGMNPSTLHRYCTGEAVPLDFAPVERLAALCGATPAQRLELHRCWLEAVAARHQPRAGRATKTGDMGESAVDAGDEAAGGAGTAVTDVGEPGPEEEDGGPDPVPPQPGAVSQSRRPWYRRKRPAAGLACACTVLATLAALSALPDGQRSPAGTPAAAGPAASGTAKAKTKTKSDVSERPRASTGPSRTPADARSAQAPAPRKSRATAPSDAASAAVDGERPARSPLTWSVNSHAWKFGCGHDYVIAQPPSRVPPPPAPQDAAPWAATQNAVHGGETLVQLTVQGLSDTAVVLEALRVRVVGRSAPAGGNAYAMDQGCGGSLTPRAFAVDLDKDRPLARAVAGNDAGTPIPAVRMPYRVSATDPEVLHVTAATRTCDCQWYLELDWSSQGRTGTLRVDDGGRPFRTSSVEGLPRYTYDTLDRHWQPLT
ncbi:helix-turn-helix transcriptional regulator [Streptomyces sp. SID5606]|uniref:helix-turn-helix domain-containing protein n=1 Tax=Streptomyces sp. SID5606 TaxID=2690305 RepID=UPI00136FF0CA|nr:helix-turn-helix transcriptional regulator [Streptomyces sp. SID5606]MZD57450.1 helix-turn-helix domain-containing protein [Streptomyces sp. SID5606]